MRSSDSRGAARCGDKGVLEQHALACNRVNVRRFENRIDGGTGIHRRVALGVTAPIIGEKEEDVGRFCRGGTGNGEEVKNGKEGDERVFHGMVSKF